MSMCFSSAGMFPKMVFLAFLYQELVPEKHMDMIHYQELVPEKATWNMNAGFGDVKTPIGNMYCVGSDSFKRSMGLTRTSYSIIKMLETVREDGNL